MSQLLDSSLSTEDCYDLNRREPADELHFRTMTKGANANFQHHTFYETAPGALNCDQCSSHE